MFCIQQKSMQEFCTRDLQAVVLKTRLVLARVGLNQNGRD